MTLTEENKRKYEKVHLKNQSLTDDQIKQLTYIDLLKSSIENEEKLTELLDILFEKKILTSPDLDKIYSRYHMNMRDYTKFSNELKRGA